LSERDPLHPRAIGSGEGLELAFSDLGATWRSCRLRLGDGRWREVLLDSEILEPRPGFMGSTIGRYANRIARGSLARNGREWLLARAPGECHQLHGGPRGFHVRKWECFRQSADSLAWVLHSPHGDQGFPGALDVTLTMTVVDTLSLEWRCRATATAACPVALTNHAYFNLDAAATVLGHRLRVVADRYSQVDPSLIPIGQPASVDGTDFDFRATGRLADRWKTSAQQRLAGGFDHGFLLNPQCSQLRSVAASLEGGDGRVRLDISTTYPALQVYTGQNLEKPCTGIALEPGFLADSPNHPEWPQPSCWLEPGEEFEHVIRYAFTVL
jgi:aldose 1-epimerase